MLPSRPVWSLRLLMSHRWSSGIMSSRKNVSNPNAPVKNETKTIATSDTSARLWRLLPSAEQLSKIAVGDTWDTAAQPQSMGGQYASSLNVRNLLTTLPRPLSLDEVKERLRATTTTRNARAK